MLSLLISIQAGTFSRWQACCEHPRNLDDILCISACFHLIFHVARYLSVFITHVPPPPLVKKQSCVLAASRFVVPPFDTYIHTYLHTYIQAYIHTIFSHTIFLCHTQSFTYHFVTQLFLLLDPSPPPLSFLPSPSRYNICCSLLEEVDMWVYPSPLKFPYRE